MKITDVKTVLLTGPCQDDPYILECRRLRSAAFIEIHTDTEHIGLGETYAGYFCPEVVPGVVDAFKDVLIGQNVDDIPELWRRMYRCHNFWGRVGLGIIVLNGIEAALWDLKGKLLNQPVYRLLSDSPCDRILAYASGGPSNYPKERMAEKINFYRSRGFNAVKVGAGCIIDGQGSDIVTKGAAANADFEAEKAAFLRAELGIDYHILFDGHMSNNHHGTWDLEVAQAVLEAVSPYGIFLYEEPLHYSNMQGYAALREASTVPVAGGECLTALSEWQVFIDHDCFDIAQPDASFVGGLSLFVDIANQYAKQGRTVAPHAAGAGGSLMQNVHCGFACSNICILEVPPAYGPLHGEIMGDSLRLKDGYLLPPETPGLGIELTDRIKEKFDFVEGSGEFVSVPGKQLTT